MKPTYEELEAKVRELEVRLMASRSARSAAEQRLAFQASRSEQNSKLIEDHLLLLVGLRQLMVNYGETAQHLTEEVAKGWLAGDFLHPKAERAQVLAGCVVSLNRLLVGDGEPQ